MATKRKRTKNIIVIVSDTLPDAGLFEIAAKYREAGATRIGSHYLVDSDGDATSVTHKDEHGNVHESFNADSIYLEVIGTVETYMNSVPQQAAIAGLVKYLEEVYTDAEELNWAV